jgi:phage-related tail protein
MPDDTSTNRETSAAATDENAAVDLDEVVRQIEALRRERGSGVASAPAPREPVVAEKDIAADEAQSSIDQLRATRSRPGRDTSIRELVASTDRRAAGVQRRLGALVKLWETHVPEAIVARTRLAGLRGGVLQVKADTSSVAYELDRLLREGLLATLRREHDGPLARVRITVTGAPD